MASTLTIESQKAFSSFAAPLTSYLGELPREIPQSAGRSFAYSFAVTTVLQGSVASGIMSGMLAATASLVDSLIRPAFNKLFANPDSLEYSFISLLVKSILVSSVVIGVASAIAVPVGFSLTTNIAYCLFTSFVMSYFNPEQSNRATDYLFTRV